MAGAIYHNGQWYGLGNTVEANPVGSASDTLSKLGIDGDIYSVSSLELGETSSTAYRGDRGKTAYDHATESGRSGAKSAGLYKIGVTAQGHVASATAVAKADLTALGVADQNDVDAIEEDIEGYKTVTGKYITVTDAASLPADSYSLTLSPVQEGSGDPSPSNVRPIHGADEVGVRVCGKNLFDQDTVYGQYKQTDGSFRLTGINADGIKNNVPAALVGQQLTFSCYADLSKETSPTRAYVVAMVNGTAVYGTAIEHDTKGVCSVTFTPTSTNDQFWVSYGSSGQNYFTLNNVQLEVDSTATDYEPYTLHSTTITLPSTVYGGSVEQGGSGESNKYSYVLTGTETTIYKHNTIPSVFGINMDDVITSLGGVVGDSATLVYRGKNSMFIPQSYRAAADMLDHTTDSYTGGFGDSGRTGVWFRIKESTFADLTVEQFKAKLAEYYAAGTPLQYVFDVVPTSLSVTPFPQTLLEGVNNVWAEMVENSTVIDNAQQSLSYQPQNIVGQLRQEIEAKPNSFAELSDTSFSNLANGQIPKWNSTTSKWENANESGGGGASSLAELSDTNISSPADGQILKYDNATSKWVNAAEYSYTLPTASASTKGGIKVGDNLSMNGEVLSAKTVPWTKIWNYRSGTSFVWPSDKSEMLLVIAACNPNTGKATAGVASQVFPITDPVAYSQQMTVAYTSSTGSETGIVYTNMQPVFFTTSTGTWDFEIWVR